MNNADKFFKHLRLFSNSLVIKFDDIAYQTEQFVTKNPVPNRAGKREWKYWRNLEGKAYPLDKQVEIKVIETEAVEPLSIELLEKYQLTKDELLKGEDYYISLINSYPGETLFIQGCLFPVNVDNFKITKEFIDGKEEIKVTSALEVEDGTILSYNKNLLEPQEDNVIEELEKWIKGFIKKYYNYKYSITDELYLPSFLAVLYTYIPYKIFNIMVDNIKSYRANSYFLELYFRGKLDVWDNLQALKNKKTIWWLYSNLDRLVKHIGKNRTADTIVDKIFEADGIGIGINYIKYRDPELSDTPYDINKLPFNPEKPQMFVDKLNNSFRVNDNKTTTLENTILEEIDMVGAVKGERREYVKETTIKELTDKNYGTNVTKLHELSTLENFDGWNLDIYGILLDYWGYMLKTNRYGSFTDEDITTLKVDFLDPNTKRKYTLTSKQGYLIFLKIILASANKLDTKLHGVTISNVLNPNANLANLLMRQLYQDGYTQLHKDYIYNNYPVPAKSYLNYIDLGRFFKRVIKFYKDIWILICNSENSAVSGNLRMLMYLLAKHETIELHTEKEGKTIDQLLQEVGITFEVPENYNYIDSVKELLKVCLGVTTDPNAKLEELLKNLKELFSKLTSYTTQIKGSVSTADNLYIYYNNIQPFFTKKGIVKLDDSRFNLEPNNNIEFRSRFITPSDDYANVWNFEFGPIPVTEKDKPFNALVNVEEVNPLVPTSAIYRTQLPTLSFDRFPAVNKLVELLGLYHIKETQEHDFRIEEIKSMMHTEEFMGEDNKDLDNDFSIKEFITNSNEQVIPDFNPINVSLGKTSPSVSLRLFSAFSNREIRNNTFYPGYSKVNGRYEDNRELNLLLATGLLEGELSALTRFKVTTEVKVMDINLTYRTVNTTVREDGKNLLVLRILPDNKQEYVLDTDRGSRDDILGNYADIYWNNVCVNNTDIIGVQVIIKVDYEASSLAGSKKYVFGFGRKSLDSGVPCNFTVYSNNRPAVDMSFIKDLGFGITDPSFNICISTGLDKYNYRPNVTVKTRIQFVGMSRKQETVFLEETSTFNSSVLELIDVNGTKEYAVRVNANNQNLLANYIRNYQKWLNNENGYKAKVKVIRMEIMMLDNTNKVSKTTNLLWGNPALLVNYTYGLSVNGKPVAENGNVNVPAIFSSIEDRIFNVTITTDIPIGAGTTTVGVCGEFFLTNTLGEDTLLGSSQIENVTLVPMGDTQGYTITKQDQRLLGNYIDHYVNYMSELSRWLNEDVPDNKRKDKLKLKVTVREDGGADLHTYFVTYTLGRGYQGNASGRFGWKFYYPGVDRITTGNYFAPSNNTLTVNDENHHIEGEASGFTKEPFSCYIILDINVNEKYPLMALYGGNMVSTRYNGQEVRENLTNHGRKISGLNNVSAIMGIFRGPIRRPNGTIVEESRDRYYIPLLRQEFAPNLGIGRVYNLRTGFSFEKLKANPGDSNGMLGSTGPTQLMNSLGGNTPTGIGKTTFYLNLALIKGVNNYHKEYFEIYYNQMTRTNNNYHVFYEGILKRENNGTYSRPFLEVASESMYWVTSMINKNQYLDCYNRILIETNLDGVVDSLPIVPNNNKLQPKLKLYYRFARTDGTIEKYAVTHDIGESYINFVRVKVGTGRRYKWCIEMTFTKLRDFINKIRTVPSSYTFKGIAVSLSGYTNKTDVMAEYNEENSYSYFKPKKYVCLVIGNVSDIVNPFKAYLLRTDKHTNNVETFTTSELNKPLESNTNIDGHLDLILESISGENRYDGFRAITEFELMFDKDGFFFPSTSQWGFDMSATNNQDAKLVPVPQQGNSTSIPYPASYVRNGVKPNTFRVCPDMVTDASMMFRQYNPTHATRFVDLKYVDLTYRYYPFGFIYRSILQGEAGFRITNFVPIELKDMYPELVTYGSIPIGEDRDLHPIVRRTIASNSLDENYWTLSMSGEISPGVSMTRTRSVYYMFDKKWLRTNHADAISLDTNKLLAFNFNTPVGGQIRATGRFILTTYLGDVPIYYKEFTPDDIKGAGMVSTGATEFEVTGCCKTVDNTGRIVNSLGINLNEIMMHTGNAVTNHWSSGTRSAGFCTGRLRTELQINGTDRIDLDDSFGKRDYPTEVGVLFTAGYTNHYPGPFIIPRYSNIEIMVPNLNSTDLNTFKEDLKARVKDLKLAVIPGNFDFPRIDSPNNNYAYFTNARVLVVECYITNNGLSQTYASTYRHQFASGEGFQTDPLFNPGLDIHSCQAGIAISTAIERLFTRADQTWFNNGTTVFCFKIAVESYYRTSGGQVNATTNIVTYGIGYEPMLWQPSRIQELLASGNVNHTEDEYFLYDHVKKHRLAHNDVINVPVDFYDPNGVQNLYDALVDYFENIEIVLRCRATGSPRSIDVKTATVYKEIGFGTMASGNIVSMGVDLPKFKLPINVTADKDTPLFGSYTSGTCVSYKFGTMLMKHALGDFQNANAFINMVSNFRDCDRVLISLRMTVDGETQPRQLDLVVTKTKPVTQTPALGYDPISKTIQSTDYPFAMMPFGNNFLPRSSVAINQGTLTNPLPFEVEFFTLSNGKKHILQDHDRLKMDFGRHPGLIEEIRYLGYHFGKSKQEIIDGGYNFSYCIKAHSSLVISDGNEIKLEGTEFGINRSKISDLRDVVGCNKMGFQIDQMLNTPTTGPQTKAIGDLELGCFLSNYLYYLKNRVYTGSNTLLEDVVGMKLVIVVYDYNSGRSKSTTIFFGNMAKKFLSIRKHYAYLEYDRTKMLLRGNQSIVEDKTNNTICSYSKLQKTVFQEPFRDLPTMTLPKVEYMVPKYFPYNTLDGRYNPSLYYHYVLKASLEVYNSYGELIDILEETTNTTYTSREGCNFTYNSSSPCNTWSTAAIRDLNRAKKRFINFSNPTEGAFNGYSELFIARLFSNYKSLFNDSYRKRNISGLRVKFSIGSYVSEYEQILNNAKYLDHFTDRYWTDIGYPCRDGNTGSSREHNLDELFRKGDYGVLATNNNATNVEPIYFSSALDVINDRVPAQEIARDLTRVSSRKTFDYHIFPRVYGFNTTNTNLHLIRDLYEMFVSYKFNIMSYDLNGTPRVLMFVDTEALESYNRNIVKSSTDRVNNRVFGPDHFYHPEPVKYVRNNYWYNGYNFYTSEPLRFARSLIEGSIGGYFKSGGRLKVGSFEMTLLRTKYEDLHDLSNPKAKAIKFRRVEEHKIGKIVAENDMQLTNREKVLKCLAFGFAREATIKAGYRTDDNGGIYQGYMEGKGPKETSYLSLIGDRAFNSLTKDGTNTYNINEFKMVTNYKTNEFTISDINFYITAVGVLRDMNGRVVYQTNVVKVATYSGSQFVNGLQERETEFGKIMAFRTGLDLSSIFSQCEQNRVNRRSQPNNIDSEIEIEICVFDTETNTNLFLGSMFFTIV